MRLTAVSIFDIMTVATTDDYPKEYLEELAGRYIGAADRRRCLAGNLPILLQESDGDLYEILDGTPRFLAALAASRRERWITRVNAIVLDEGEAFEADMQMEVEELGFCQVKEAITCDS